ncbi:hypothetical protein AMECASPLE_006033 [Ameca splendens]|uniref:Uncharacterized protein n=1 Tax=Ameca splendens TaxID=208324 RepID=A0ABV0ZV64_9TELE
MQKDPRPGIEPRTFLLQGNSATNCATVQPVIKSIYKILTFHPKMGKVGHKCKHPKRLASNNLRGRGKVSIDQRRCHEIYGNPGGAAEIHSSGESCNSNI